MLFNFMPRHHVPKSPPARLDAGLSDYADFAYLAGETSAHGDKHQATLAADYPQQMPPGPNLFPLFDRALKGWRKASPTFTRCGHPEGVSFAICGVLFRRRVPAMALYNATLLSTYLRPSALMALATADVVDPSPATTSMSCHFAPLVSPQDREGRSKTGDYDATVVLDDVRHQTWGWELAKMRVFMNEQFSDGDDDSVVPLWPFQAKHFLREWKAAVRELNLGGIIKSPYEERHSGISRDLLLKLRSKEEAAARGHWKRASSARNYDKAARMQKVANDIGADVLEYGESVRQSFHQYFKSGVDQGWLLDRGVINVDASTSYHL